MRLTLRTLLAYLDDTLPPSEAKAMGTKLAESEPAQEIVERIKNVIRRRRLTVPPAESRMDSNTIAEYLDNEITPELAEELERICLASDVHLAEVAACHQILSLVLGEATAAPEEAVKRMYALGKGDATKSPKRTARPAAPADKPHPVDRETDETLRMGLPSVFGKDRANRVMIFAGAALASLLLVVAIMQLLKKPDGTTVVSDNVDQAKLDLAKQIAEKRPPELIALPPTPVKSDEKKTDALPESKVLPEKEAKADVDDLPPPAFSVAPDKKIEAMIANIGYAPSSAKVTPIGHLLEPAKDQVAVVVQQIPKTAEWKRLSGKQDLLSARPLVSLPGSKASLATKGIRLTLWGNIPEQVPSPPAQESMVELYDHDALDLDMSLQRGLVTVANLRDEPSIVRIRFENPSVPGGSEAYWFLTLTGKNAEAVIGRWSAIPRGEPFFKSKDDPERKGPVADIMCMAIAGTVFVKTPTDSATLTSPPISSIAVWSSTTKKLVTMALNAPPPWLDAKAATPPDIAKTRLELANAFTGKAIDVGLAEILKANDVLTRRTAVRCLGAMDDLPGLLDMLNQDKIDQRVAAVETLVQWIAHSRDNDYKLNDLALQRFKVNEANTFMELLHGFSDQAASRPETYELLIGYLNHNQNAIRELAAWNLYRMVPAAGNILYDANDPAKRERAHRKWLDLIPPGKLPPPPPPSPKLKAAAEPRIEMLRATETATATFNFAPRTLEQKK